MDHDRHGTSEKRTLIVTLSLMGGIMAAILGLSVVGRSHTVPPTGASATRATSGPLNTATGTVREGFGATGRSFGSIAHG